MGWICLCASPLITGAGKSVGREGGRMTLSQGLRREMAISSPDPISSFRTPTVRAFKCPWLPGLRASKGNDFVTKIPGEFSFPPSLNVTPQGTRWLSAVLAEGWPCKPTHWPRTCSCTVCGIPGGRSCPPRTAPRRIPEGRCGSGLWFPYRCGGRRRGFTRTPTFPAVCCPRDTVPPTTEDEVGSFSNLH